MRSTNSKNCVARTIVYGIAQALISFSWATFARKYPLAGSRSVPTIESATWCATLVFASAASTLRVEVSKNSNTALSSNEGEFVTSTTTCAPVSASVKPSPVIELMPCEGDAATTSWPPARSRFTTLLPMSPVPPRITIFISLFLVSDALSFVELPGVRGRAFSLPRYPAESGAPSVETSTELGAYRNFLKAGRQVKLQLCYGKRQSL